MASRAAETQLMGQPIRNPPVNQHIGKEMRRESLPEVFSPRGWKQSMRAEPHEVRNRLLLEDSVQWQY